MILALYIIGAVVFVISVVAGFLSGSLMGFFISVAIGVSSAIILFALVRILENQDNILYKLQYQEEVTRRTQRQEKVCPKCNYKYDGECNSCPHCGYKD